MQIYHFTNEQPPNLKLSILFQEQCLPWLSINLNLNGEPYFLQNKYVTTDIQVLKIIAKPYGI
jgi:hypothetical protein